MQFSDDTITRSSTRWFAIVNPAAGEGRIGREWQQIEHLLREAGIRADIAFTQYKYHAVELTVEAVNNGFRNLIVVGGDSTFHEVVNGLFIQKSVKPNEVTIGIIPAHAVNPRREMTGIPLEYPAAIEIIAAGYSSLKAVAVASYHKANYKQRRYIATTAGIGMDASAVKSLGHLREEGKYGKFRQWLASVKLILSHRPAEVKIWIDDKPAGSCKVASALMQIDTRDQNEKKGGNTLTLSVLRDINRVSLLFRIKSLRNGSIHHTAEALLYRGNRIRIETSDTIAIEADGERLGYSPIELKLLERAIRIAVPKSMADTAQPATKSGKHKSTHTSSGNKEIPYVA